MILTSNTGDDTDIHIIRVNYRRSLYRQVVNEFIAVYILDTIRWRAIHSFVVTSKDQLSFLACVQYRAPRSFLEMFRPIIALGWEMN